MARIVYGLKASDEPLQVRYIGATTQRLEVRLRQHIQEIERMIRAGPWRGYGRKNHQKSVWLSDVLRRGARVLIEPLSVHETDEEMASAEMRWISFWRNYTELLNLDTVNRHGGKRKVVRV